MTPGIATLGCLTEEGKNKKIKMKKNEKKKKRRKGLAFTSHTMPQHERLAKGKRSIEECISG